jgi:hypothetical protein
MDKIQLNDIPNFLKSLYCLVHKDLKSSSSNRKYSCRCENCKNWNTLRNFYRRNTNEKYRLSQNLITNNYKKNNPEKHKESNKNWYYSNLEKAREINRRATRRRNARKLNNGFEHYTEIQVLSLYGNQCSICSILIDLSATRVVGKDNWEMGLHIDHVIPISKGGPDTLENVRPAHALCNLRKHAS